MAATEGTAIFIGLQSRKTYVEDMYLSDTVNTVTNWNSGAGAAATSREHITFPEGVVLTDVAVVTGAAQTKLQIIVDGVPTGQMLRQTLHLNTLAVRPPLRIPFGARQEISMMQLA